MLNYLIEMLVCQALFLGLYQLFKSEPFFRVNRVYLIFSLVLSLVLPLFSFSDVLPFQVSQTYVEWMQPAQIGLADAANQPTFSETQVQAMQGFQWNLYYVIYGTGLTLYIVWFMFRNRLLFKYLNLNSFDSYKFKPVVILSKTSEVFSFLDRIYIGKEIPESQRQVILEHEYQHIKKKHSLELLFVELLQFVMWFNPMIYIYKLQLRQLHEFEVDHSVTSQYSVKNYINTLLNQSFGSQSVSFVHTFSRSSELKKRIKMLRKTHRSQLNKLKYLLILPVISLAILFSCTQDEGFKRELTKEEMNEQAEMFFNRVFKSDPNIHEIIEEKPNLKDLLNYYDLEVKNNYSNLEEGKVGFIIGLLTSTKEFKTNLSYKDRILSEIKKSNSLQEIYDTIQVISKRSRRKGFEAANFGNESNIPFSLIDNPPHPQSCKGLTGDDLKKCMSDFIGKHVSDTFKLPDLGLDLKPGRKRISVQFMIDKNGKIQEVKAKGPNPELEKEATKTIKGLPQFIPGEHDGEKVNVLYGLPINFVVSE